MGRVPAREAIVIREARPSDIPVIFDIRYSVRENILTSHDKVTPEICREYLETKGKGWIAEVDGGAIGFSIAVRDDSSIWALFVRPELEGRGAGTQLLAAATKWLFDHGADEISLTTGAETAADLFYQRQGWRRGAIDRDGEVEFSLVSRAGGAR